MSSATQATSFHILVDPNVITTYVVGCTSAVYVFLIFFVGLQFRFKSNARKLLLTFLFLSVAFGLFEHLINAFVFVFAQWECVHHYFAGSFYTLSYAAADAVLALKCFTILRATRAYPAVVKKFLIGTIALIYIITCVFAAVYIATMRTVRVPTGPTTVMCVPAFPVPWKYISMFAGSLNGIVMASIFIITLHRHRVRTQWSIGAADSHLHELERRSLLSSIGMVTIQIFDTVITNLLTTWVMVPILLDHAAFDMLLVYGCWCEARSRDTNSTHTSMSTKVTTPRKCPEDLEMEALTETRASMRDNN